MSDKFRSLVHERYEPTPSEEVLSLWRRHRGEDDSELMRARRVYAAALWKSMLPSERWVHHGYPPPPPRMLLLEALDHAHYWQSDAHREAFQIGMARRG